MSGFTDQIYSLCKTLGLVGYATHCASEMAVGISLAHPTLIVGIVISGAFAKFASFKLSESQIFYELDMWANYFAKVTSNLNAFYKFAS